MGIVKNPLSYLSYSSFSLQDSLSRPFTFLFLVHLGKLCIRYSNCIVVTLLVTIFHLRLLKILLLNNTVKIFFWFRKNQTDASRKGSVMCRIQMQGKKDRTEITTKIKIHSKQWNEKTKRVKGEGAKTSNEKLRILRHQLEEIEIECAKRGITLTAKKVAYFYRHGFTNDTSVLNAFDVYIDQKEKLQKAGELSPATLKRYKNYRTYFREFLTLLKRPDFLLSEITQDVGFQFFDFLKYERELPIVHNSAVKVTYFLSAVMNMAVRKEWVQTNKLRGLNLKKEPKKELIYLTDAELYRLENHLFVEQSLQICADMYILQSHTGMAYSDLVDFDFGEMVFYARDGTPFIHGNRHKTGEEFIVPLSVKAQEILLKYNNSIPKIKYHNTQKVISLQRYNDNLLLIAKYLGIDKHITSHTARVTAAMRWYKNYPDKIIEKMMGASIKIIREHYARITGDTVIEAFHQIEQQEKQNIHLLTPKFD